MTLKSVEKKYFLGDSAIFSLFWKITGNNRVFCCSVGAPEFRKEGGREKKEKIVESKKKTSTTPVESRSSYSTGIGARRSIFYRKSRIFGA